MSLITSPEFFINMKSVPKKGDADFQAFLDAELDKLQYGITVNGVYIPNWLYWHINHWRIYRPAIDERNGDVIDIFDRPQLRDNEWMIAEALEEAKRQKKGLILIGSRRLAKTTFVASWLGLGATIYEGSQNVIVGNNKGDISNITTQMDKGLLGLESFLRYGRINDDWKKEVSLGFKDKKGNRYEFSRIIIKNTEEGNNTEVLAGLTPKTLVFDEIGKANTKEAFLAGLKTFASPYGWRCVPILTGTGGDMKKGEDAKEMFNYPDRFNFLEIDVKGENRKTGLFISGLYSVDIPKIEKPLSEFLNVPFGSELDTIKIYVSDKELGLKMIQDDRAKWLKAQDQVEYLKAVMYAPLDVDECFLDTSDENPFPVEALKQHLDFLQRTQEKKCGKLYRDTSGIVQFLEDSKLKPVSEFPATKDTDKRGCVVIYEDVMLNPPNFLYIGGGDPYNQDKSPNSPSLGSLYIYKRLYDPVNGTFQNRIVASYVARPETMKEWHETVEMLLEYYNATLMIENAGTNFIQYMENKNKGHWLADGYNLAKEINPKTSIQGRLKGLPPTPKIQSHYRNLILQYCTEKIPVGQSNQNGEMIEVLGLTRLTDEMLIRELIEFKPKLNVDRIVAFGHVLVYDEYLQKIAPNVKIKEETDNQEVRRNTIRSPFILNKPNQSRNSSPFIL